MICLLGGCLEGIHETTPDDFIPDGNKIRQGRRLFQKVCIKCHQPRNIRQYNDQEWEKIIAKKLKKDPLMMSPTETKSILYFLTYGNSGTAGFSPFAGPPGTSFTQKPISD